MLCINTGIAFSSLADDPQTSTIPLAVASPTPQDKVIILQERITQLMERVGQLEDQVNDMKETLANKNNHSLESKAITAKKAEPLKNPADIQTVKVSAPVASQATLSPVNEDATLNFRKAYALYQSEKFPEAILEWSQFLKDYPDHVFAGSAQYYLGDSYYRQKEFKLAAAEFNKVIVSYDRSSHVSDALKKLYLCEEKTGDTKAAVKHRTLLTTLFAQSPAAKEQNNPLEKTNTIAKPEAPAPVIQAKSPSSVDLPPENHLPMTAPMAPVQKLAPPPEEEEEPKEIND